MDDTRAGDNGPGSATHGGAERKRIILLASNLTYRIRAFLAAAERLDVETVRGLDMPRPLAAAWQPTLPLDFKSPDQAVSRLVDYARGHPVDAIISVDDSATIIAARACAKLGIPHNDAEASNAARDKYVMRQRLSRHGVPCPNFRLVNIDDDPEALGDAVAFPCVVKPATLSGSQGVIRANTPEEFVTAFRRTRSIVVSSGTSSSASNGAPPHMLIEEYLPGDEVVVEGILAGGRLHVLAIFDKPDPLVGPFFEETIYVTPSRLPMQVQDDIIACTTRACTALGLRLGPIHAELRINDRGPWIVEIAGRSIGGLCAKILRFGSENVALEELILRQALGMPIATLQREQQAGGVMMIPIPKAGVLKGVDGVEEAKQVSGIEEIDITMPLHYPVVPLPEGSSYLGFIFARRETPEQVEQALREAHRRLSFTIVPHIALRRRG